MLCLRVRTGAIQFNSGNTSRRWRLSRWWSFRQALQYLRLFAADESGGWVENIYFIQISSFLNISPLRVGLAGLIRRTMAASWYDDELGIAAGAVGLFGEEIPHWLSFRHFARRLREWKFSVNYKFSHQGDPIRSVQTVHDFDVCRVVFHQTTAKLEAISLLVSVSELHQLSLFEFNVLKM